MIKEPEVSRRTFILAVGSSGVALALGGFGSLACAASKAPHAAKFVPNGFVEIDSDGVVTITIAKSDMGQGVRTSLAMLAAEELDADWAKVKVVQSNGDRGLYGEQGTGGSSSIRTMHQKMRELGASARAMIVAAAAQQWNVDPSTCTTSNGEVLHADSGRKASYGSLVVAACSVPVPASGAVKLKSKEAFKILGKPTKRVDNQAVVTGKAMFGLDVHVDGMLYAVMARPEVIGATLGSVDDAEARKVPGVVDVFNVGNAVAVVATNTWSAIKGRSALKINWNASPNVGVSSETIRAGLTAAIIAHPAMPDGAKVVSATIDLPYLAHATMEPMNAVASVTDTTCEIWSGTQSANGALETAAGVSGIPPQHVTVHNMLLGGGFGRRSSLDFLIEAVSISKHLKKPVKLTWTREDDMRNDFYRSMSHHDLKAAVQDGAPVAYSHQMIEAGGRRSGSFRPGGISYNIPNAGMLHGSAPSVVRNGAWRSVEHSQINVVNECFLDEVAVAAGKDPMKFRQDLASNPRLKKVLEVAAEKSGWGGALPAGSGRGVAAFDSYGACIAHVVELTVTGDKIKVDRIVAVVDPGTAINPLGIEAQIQGAASDGLSTALHAAITVKGGAIEQGNWVDYEWMTLDQMPKIEVTIIESGDDPSGMGEVGYPSVPPAIANAVFAATGKRVRKFPIQISELV